MTQLTPYLNKLLGHEHLTRIDLHHAMEIIMCNDIPEQTAAFLSILKFRGENIHEVLSIIEVIKKSSESIELAYPTLDIVGTGGDNANTVNISTGSAILAAACGIPVTKHGNRAVSSQCGAADVLEVLGIKIDMNKQMIEDCLNQLNLAFLFAPQFHPALMRLREIRKKMAFPTILNILGPLLNPAHAAYRVIGVAREENLELMSDLVANMPEIKDAYVFHSCGLDELTTLGPTQGYRIRSGKKEAMTIDPLSLGFTTCRLSDLQGGNKFKNAVLLCEALSNKKGAIADAIILNTAVALLITEKFNSLTESVSFARTTLESGMAINTLNKWIAFSEQLTRYSA